MAVVNQRPIYLINECVQVQTNSTTAVDVYTIQAQSVIEKVTVLMVTPAVRAAGGVDLTVGDDDSANGYILAASAKGAANTVYGDAVAECGTYIDATTPNGKFYTAVGKEIKIVCSAANDTEAVAKVIIKGYRYS
jgi:hypothetical protein